MKIAIGSLKAALERSFLFTNPKNIQGRGWKTILLCAVLSIVLYSGCNTAQEENGGTKEKRGTSARIEGRWKTQDISMKFKGMYKLMEAFKGIYEEHFDGLTIELKEGGECVVGLKDKLNYGGWELRDDSTLVLKGLKEEKMAEQWHILDLKEDSLQMRTEKKELSMKALFLRKE